MNRDQAKTILTGMTQIQKKDLLDTLAASLFKNFNGIEKKEFLQKVIS